MRAYYRDRFDLCQFRLRNFTRQIVVAAENLIEAGSKQFRRHQATYTTASLRMRTENCENKTT